MKKVAVIGAGASGIITAKTLIEKGFDVTLFEKTPFLGGLWNYTDDPSGVLYKSLQTNLPKEIMVFINDSVDYKCNESFCTHYHVKEYLVSNAKAWGIDRITKFETEVISLKRLNSQYFPSPPFEIPKNIQKNVLNLNYVGYSSSEENTRWVITYKTKDMPPVTCEFDFVAICNGHHNTPTTPQINGLDNVTVPITHSKSYRSPNNFGQKILCLGYSASGFDISKELADTGRQVYVVEKKSGQDLEQNTDMIDKNDPHKNLHCFISSPIKLTSLKNGNCLVESENGKTFECNHILFCTGFDYSFPFLEKGLLTTVHKTIHPLAKETIHAVYPTLAFVGINWKILPFLFFESQAKFIAAHWSDKIKSMSTLKSRLKSMYERYDYVRNQLQLPKHYSHFLEDDQWSYNKDLITLSGNASDKNLQQINMIRDIYNDARKLRAEHPFIFRNTEYEVDLNTYKWERKAEC